MYSFMFFIILFEFNFAVRVFGYYAEPPSPFTEHPIIKNVKAKMITKKQGYFTAFVQELCTIIAVKDPLQSMELYRALEQMISNMVHRQGRLIELGTRFETAITFMTEALTALEPNVTRGYASILARALEEKEVAFAADILSLLHDLDNIYTFQEGEELLNTLVQVDEYPKNDSALVVAESVVEKVLRPYFRLAGSQTRQALIQSVYNVMEKRSLGRRRLVDDVDDKMFDKDYRRENNNSSGFSVDSRRKNDKNDILKLNFTELNSMERIDVIVRELIENVQEMETIKKIKIKKVHTSTKSRPDFNKRANSDEIQPKNNGTLNNVEEVTIGINFNNRKIKMLHLDDEVKKNKPNIKQNYKSKKHRNSRKTFYAEMGIAADRFSGSTSESESGSESASISHRNNMDTDTKEKIKNNLIRNHVNLQKSLKKHQETNENKGRDTLNVTEKPLDDEMLAKDSEKPLSDKLHSNEENRQLSNNRRLYSNRRRSPGAYKRSADDIIGSPDKNQLPSIYLIPKIQI